MEREGTKVKDKTCEERIDKALESTLDDLRTLWAAYTNAGCDCEKCNGTGEAWAPCVFCGNWSPIDPGCESCGGEGGEYKTCPTCDGEGTLDEDGNIDDLGNMYEYGLAFDYVAPETFNDQPEGWFRYQLSTGGPGDEFRIFAQKVDDYRFSVYRIEYWFLDWFDGASRTLYGEDRELLDEIFTSLFVDSGTANIKLQEATDW